MLVPARTEGHIRHYGLTTIPMVPADDKLLVDNTIEIEHIIDWAISSHTPLF